ncbi:MAG: PIG-L deacetylase family protein [Propionibacteriaceae bacterium]
MRSLTPGPLTEVVLVGAHCDDIAIGAGGTVLALAATYPRLRVRALVLTGGGTAREVEERAALRAFLPDADLEITVLDLPDGRTPDHWLSAKTGLQDLARTSTPDLVLAPQPADAHQDHRLLAELVPQAFRDALVLGYEILKWESDLPPVTLYQPIPDDLARRKCTLLAEHYPSQHPHDWFDDEAFLGLMRIRGAQCHTRYAEAYVSDKLVLDLG